MASLPEWRAVSAPLGVTRAVLFQPSAYGTDNSRMLNGLREAGDMARGIAVIDDATPDHSLEEMNAFGVCGIRLNLATGVVPDPTAIPGQLRRAALRIARFGWHLQVLARGTHGSKPSLQPCRRSTCLSFSTTWQVRRPRRVPGKPASKLRSVCSATGDAGSSYPVQIMLRTVVRRRRRRCQQCAN